MTSFGTRAFKVAVSEPSEPISRASRRIIINTEILKQAKVYAGDVVAIVSLESHKATAIGIAWPASEIPQESILVSEPLLLTARVTEGAKVKLFSLDDPKLPRGVPSLQHAELAHTVHVKELLDAKRSKRGSTSKPSPKGADSGNGKSKNWLTLLIREALIDLTYITPTQTLEVVYEGKPRRFNISSVSTTREAAHDPDIADDIQSLSLLDAPPKLWSVGWETTVILDSESSKTVAEEHQTSDHAIEHGVEKDAYTSVGGLDKQIAQIRDLIEIPLTRPELFRQFGLKPPRGILLHGPPGTGKTHLARAIAASTGSAVLIVNGPELSSAYHGETEAKIRDVFSEARARSPCIIVLDEVDALCPRREEGPGGEVEKRVVAQLLTLMDGMEDEGTDGSHGKVVVVATTNRPNAIDPALRRPGRFDREIEVGIPNSEARFSILQVLLAKAPHDIAAEDLRSVAAKAHGYVGADLSAVVREAGTLAIKRWLASAPADSSQSSPRLTLADLLAALPSVRPSALRSLFLDTVPVRYSDIGGQAETIQKLRECVEWPLLHPEAFARLGVRAPRGVLLYGPPGCSKTLLVRACATESGVNFLAVKGPELLNKFVGESERAVRDIFSKARGAAPSIIFFDEIDALATSRTATDSGGGAHEGVLTSLLNEMDGVQELVGVTIVAATNRPDVIDSALMRPGRLDRILYVGPPDLQGRIDILRIRTRKMSVGPDLDLAQIAQMTEGCSGAEMTALCQEAALLTMKSDIDAPFVPHSAFVEAAKNIKKQITPEVVQTYTAWRDGNSVADA